MATEQETLVVFSPDGVLQETVRLRNPLNHTPRMLLRDGLASWPKGTKVGRFRDQERLSGASLGLFVGIAMLNEDGYELRVFPHDRIRARAMAHSIAAAEFSMIDLTKDIEAIAAVFSMLGPYKSDALVKRFDELIERRHRAQQIVKRELVPEIAIDPLVADLAGACFYVDIDQST